MIPVFDQSEAVAAVAKLAAVSVLISSAEYLVCPRHLRDDGLMSWAVASVREQWLVTSPIGSVLQIALSYPRVLGMIVVRATLGLIVGRTSSSQLRVQMSYFFDLFAEQPSATTTTTAPGGSGTYVNGIIFSLGFCSRV